MPSSLRTVSRRSAVRSVGDAAIAVLIIVDRILPVCPLPKPGGGAAPSLWAPRRISFDGEAFDVFEPFEVADHHAIAFCQSVLNDDPVGRRGHQACVGAHERVGT